MHIAIDLGLHNSLLVCWKQGQPLDQPSISVRLPGLAVFKPEPAANLWSRPSLESYLGYLYREYMLPSRMVINSAAIAVPQIMGLKIRRQLLDIMEEVMGIDKVTIVPRYLALAAGYYLSNELTSGDIIIVDIKDTQADFAFVSVCPEVITLERQATGGLTELREEAERLGYLSPSGWNIDHVVVFGDGNDQNEMNIWLSSLAKKINIKPETNPAIRIAEGLTITNPVNNPRPPIRLSMIYPFNFYLADIDPDPSQASITRIPFDTANLEIDRDSRLKLIRYDSAGTDVRKDRIKLLVYEMNSHIELDLKEVENSPWDIVLEIDSAREDFPARVDLMLDMETAIVHPDLPSIIEETVRFTETDFWKRWAVNMANLKSPEFNDTDDVHFDKDSSILPHASFNSDLTLQIEDSLSRIQSLLSLWQKI